jgi:5'-3' exonuclease
VVYGFLKSIRALKNEFQTDRIAFCFESRQLLRKSIFPEYKARRSRKDDEPEKVDARDELRRQIEDLKLLHLPRIGFANVFSAPGFESDDLMAALALRERDVVLVTSDADLYQCLSPSVRMHCPTSRRLFTEKWFINEYGIPPRKWALVKAIAGCKGDGVPGVEGIGETTALKFIRGDEITHPKGAREKILSSKDDICRNRRLVELPFFGTPVPRLRVDRVSRKGWDEVCKQLGFRSLMGRPPIYSHANLLT